MAKQTGRRGKVKIDAIFAGLAVLLTLSACANSSWHNARKSPQEARADEKECNQRAEEAALLRTGRQRADYQMPPRAGEAYRPDTPMDLVEREDTTKRFHQLFENCMTSKGYTQGKDTPQP